MGFGFNLLFAFILVPLNIILLICWLLSRNNGFGKMLGLIWLSIIGLVLISVSMQALTAKKILKKKDFYGKYVIDRSFFQGKQADWQYDNYHFEIKENDSIYLYLTHKNETVKTFTGSISAVKGYQSERLAINMQLPTHHIMERNPTIYRDTWSFYLVLNSPKFGNMFFKKGDWKPLHGTD